MTRLSRNPAPTPASKDVDMPQHKKIYRQHRMKIVKTRAPGIAAIIWIMMFEKWIREENNAPIWTTEQKLASRTIA